MFRAPDRVQRIPRQRKKKWQSFSDLAGLYGIRAIASGNLSHEARLGLWLNRERATNRAAWIAGGGNFRNLNPEITRALSETDAQGDLFWWQIETELKRQKR